MGMSMILVSCSLIMGFVTTNAPIRESNYANFNHYTRALNQMIAPISCGSDSVKEK